MRTISLTAMCLLASFGYAFAQGSENPLICFYDRELKYSGADDYLSLEQSELGALSIELGDKQARQVSEADEDTNTIYIYKIFEWKSGNSCPPTLPKFSLCESKVAWMHGAWQSNRFYAQNGVDGSDASIRRYLSEVESVCPRP